MAEERVLRIVGDDIRAWLDDINANADPSALTDEVLSLPPTPENCATLLSKLAPGVSELPFLVRRRCEGEDEAAFRSDCFTVFTRWHDGGLRLRMEPLSNDVGCVEEANGEFVVRPGVVVGDPFGLHTPARP